MVCERSSQDVVSAILQLFLMGLGDFKVGRRTDAGQKKCGGRAVVKYIAQPKQMTEQPKG